MNASPDGFSPRREEQLALAARPSALLGEILDRRLEPDDVSTAFQPIVDLASESVVGFEALTRGPLGHHLRGPIELFAAAREAGRLAEFDRSCRDAALARAALAGLDPPLTVFVNVEPELVEDATPAHDDTTWREAPADLRCVIELTERSLTARPRELLAAVSSVRELSWGVAIDDLGANPESLALMALLRPDVLKLDMRLVHRDAAARSVDVVAAVAAHAEETGALVVAEGIEDERGLHVALALGATHGQGYFFGRPGGLPDAMPNAGPPVRFFGAGTALAGPTPLQLVREHQNLRRGSAALVHDIAEHLERQAGGLGASVVVLAAHPEGWRTDAASERLQFVSRHAALVGVVSDMPALGARVRATEAAHGDAIRSELAMTVLAPHFAAALVALPLGSGGDGDQAMEFGVTHDRELVTHCARALLARMKSSGPATA